MDVRVASLPPLGQVTISGQDVTHFTVILDVPLAVAGDPWEVAIWHSVGVSDWRETQLSQVALDATPTSLQAIPSTYVRLCYRGVLDTTSTVDFTVKFRSRPGHVWRWVKDEQSLGDGLLVRQVPDLPDFAKSGLQDVIVGLNPRLNVKSALSQSPGTQLWEIRADVHAAEHGHSAISTLELGRAWGHMCRWFALARLWSPWLVPRHGKGPFDLESDALMGAFLGPQGLHLILLGISDINNVTALIRGSDGGSIDIRLRSDNKSASTGTIVAVVGKTFENALAAAMYHARSLSNRSETDDKIELASSDIRAQWYESWYDGLGFCTWNALGPDLTSSKIEHALDELSNNGVRISNLIIDDNWQDIDREGRSQYQQGWNAFEADPKSFPGGLKSTVSRIRTKHANIQHIAVWHALLGYWGGISPNGSLARHYDTVEVEREDSGRPDVPLHENMTIIGKDDVAQFYNDFYAFLEDCGIDGVKTDVQFMLDMLKSSTDRRELINEYIDAWVIAGLRHFSLRAISCMSQVPQIMYHEQMPRNRPAFVLRNSDDFYPHVPAAHPWHLWANAHTALLTQHLNILPDWDMFQTKHEFGGFHAAARCISGGPIYITDIPGQHDLELINQISGPTTMGKTVTFRPSVIGKSVDQYTDYHDNAILKVGSYNGASGTGTPLLGIFNIASQPLTEIIPLSRFPGTISGQSYIVRSHVSGKISNAVHIDDPASDLVVGLGLRGYDILTAFPVSTFRVPPTADIHVANLGLVGKMTGAAAIMMSDVKLASNDRVQIDTRLMALGTLGIYISTLPMLSLEDDFMITILGQAIPRHTASVRGLVLSVDVAKAWSEMQLEPGWSNEVGVKVYFSIKN
ncbi:raffinose synthase Sip1 [Microdochium bolleyi]|uniref:Raffinose synthase Sip1 n=1 Tax=Microdochium bolleyi TaxID=196109 RepID=A0A136J2Q6_9PEZI|nr:raffinose synthase Sip1 [Microdochium bolleyi]